MYFTQKAKVPDEGIPSSSRARGELAKRSSLSLWNRALIKVKTAAFVRNCIVSMIQEPFAGRFQDDCLTSPVPEAFVALVNMILQRPSCVQPGDEINKQRSTIAATISQLIIHNTVKPLPTAERLLPVFKRLSHHCCWRGAHCLATRMLTSRCIPLCGGEHQRRSSRLGAQSRSPSHLETSSSTVEDGP